MYTLAIQQEFIAQLIPLGEEAGSESKRHSHSYKVELMIEGEELDQNGYVIDLEDLSTQLSAVIGQYRDQTLNEQEPFAEINPSLEHFARIICEQMDEELYAPNITAISIKLWEDGVAWVAFDLDRE